MQQFSKVNALAAFSESPAISSTIEETPPILKLNSLVEKKNCTGKKKVSSRRPTCLSALNCNSLKKFLIVIVDPLPC